jgi:diadenosine tetraphosphate (Ap4A) HIT family hydrolase
MSNVAQSSIIWETNHFVVFAEGNPLVDRDEGGHVVISPKKRISMRQDLSPTQAIEFIRLTMVVGEAMTSVMKRHGVDIGRINYQDNSNWSVFKPEGPYFHLHLYGRAKNATVQRFGESLYFPHRDRHPALYTHLKPLTLDDVMAMRREIEIIFSESKYRNEEWRI